MNSCGCGQSNIQYPYPIIRAVFAISYYQINPQFYLFSILFFFFSKHHPNVFVGIFMNFCNMFIVLYCTALG